MARRHLTEPEALAALRRGRPVEQFLGRTETGETQVVRWLTAMPADSGYILALHQVEDIGTDDFADVTQFPPLDDDEYIGEGRRLISGDSPEEILQAAVEFGAQGDRWVSEGVVQDEYVDARDHA